MSLALLPSALFACSVPAPPVTNQSGLSGPSPGTPAPPSPSPIPTHVGVDVLIGSGPGGNGAGAYRYRVEYPKLEGNTGLVLGIDSVIRGSVQRDVAEFVNAARNAPPNAAAPSTLDCMTRTDRATDRLAVLRVDCTEYHAGPAHVSASSHTFNCDLARGRVLSLQDLFTQGSEYLTVLSEAARQQLGAKLGIGDDKTLADSTAPAVDNFKEFLLEKDALVILFPRYQVADGSAGEPEVDISYGDLERYFANGVKGLVGP